MVVYHRVVWTFFYDVAAARYFLRKRDQYTNNGHSFQHQSFWLSMYQRLSLLLHYLVDFARLAAYRPTDIKSYF